MCKRREGGRPLSHVPCMCYPTVSEIPVQDTKGMHSGEEMAMGICNSGPGTKEKHTQFDLMGGVLPPFFSFCFFFLLVYGSTWVSVSVEQVCDEGATLTSLIRYSLLFLDP